MILFVTAWLQIVEAKLVTTFATCHVVASFVFEDGDGALWAVHSAVFFLPFFK